MKAKTHSGIWEKATVHLGEGVLTLRSPQIERFETSHGGKRRKDGMSQGRGEPNSALLLSRGNSADFLQLQASTSKTHLGWILSSINLLGGH